MNSLEIQYFLTIVKYGSFTEAAQALSLSASQPSANRSGSWRRSLVAACLPAPAVHFP